MKPQHILTAIIMACAAGISLTAYSQDVNPTVEVSRAYRAKHQAKGNGFGYSVIGPGDTTRTLSARYHKDGSEILVSRGEGKNPRKLTPRECARLQGFPDEFIIPVSDTQAYHQFGNSVTVPVVRAVARLMMGAMEDGLRGA